jgi:hypothetical protein
MPPAILSFTDDELALLRVVAAPLQPQQRDQFLRDVAGELKRCTGRGEKIGPGTVGQVATAVQRRLLRARQRRPSDRADLMPNQAVFGQAPAR